MQAINHKAELQVSLKARSDRAIQISELNAQNDAAQKEIANRNNKLTLLHSAQEIEQRIIALLNYLAQYPSEDKSLLLVSERAAQSTILQTLETHSG